MSVEEVRQFLDERDAAGQAAGVALLVRAWHSAPRRPGARYAAWRGEESAGSISAGCVEADLREHLIAVSAGASPRLVRYGIADADAAAIGLACGGEIEVLVDAHRADDPVWAAVREAIDGGRRVALLTALSEPLLGRRAVVTPDGASGDLSDALDPVALATAAGDALARNLAPRVVTAGAAGLELFVESVGPPNRLVVFGAGRIAESLVDLGAVLGVPVDVVDRRAGLGEGLRTRGVAPLDAEPEVALARLGVDGSCAVAVVAHDERMDVPALAAALRRGCGYVGLLGGHRTRQRRRDGLLELGFSEAEIARVRGPIGLDIGAETPAEIALAILAEVVASWRAPEVPSRGEAAPGTRAGEAVR